MAKKTTKDNDRKLSKEESLKMFHDFNDFLKNGKKLLDEFRQKLQKVKQKKIKEIEKQSDDEEKKELEKMDQDLGL